MRIWAWGLAGPVVHFWDSLGLGLLEFCLSIARFAAIEQRGNIMGLRHATVAKVSSGDLLERITFTRAGKIYCHMVRRYSLNKSFKNQNVREQFFHHFKKNLSRATKFSIIFNKIFIFISCDFINPKISLNFFEIS